MLRSRQPETDTESLWTGYSGRMFLLLSVGWLFTQLGRRLLPPLLSSIIGEFHITAFQAGLILTVMEACYAVMHFPSGRISDRLSRKTVLVGGLGLMFLGFSSLTTAPTYPFFVIGAACVGLGAGMYMVPMRACLADIFVERRGQAFGLNNAAGTGGAGIAAGLAVLVVAISVWRVAFIPVAAFLGITLLAIHWTSSEPYAIARVDLGILDTATRIFVVPRNRWLIVIYSLFAFTWVGIIAFLPLFLQAAKGFTPVLASATYAMLFVVGIVVMPLAGKLGDKVERLPVAALVLLCGAFGLLGMVVFSHTIAVIGGVIVLAIGLMAYPPIMQAYLMDVFPEDSVGGDFGIFKTVYSTIGSLGPVYIGYVTTHATYSVAYQGLILCLVVGVLFVTLMSGGGIRRALTGN